MVYVYLCYGIYVDVLVYVNVGSVCVLTRIEL